MYICTKTMKLGGEAYLPGDPVPEDAILPGRAGKLIACGYISESEAVPSKSEEKRVKAQMAEESVQEPVQELKEDSKPVQESEAAPEVSEEKPKKKKATKKEV